MFTSRSQVDDGGDTVRLQFGKLVGFRLAAGAKLFVHTQEISDWWGFLLSWTEAGNKKQTNRENKCEQFNHDLTIQILLAAECWPSWERRHPACNERLKGANCLTVREISAG